MAVESGAKAVRDRLAALLIDDLPRRITMLTELWTMPAGSIPLPDMVSSGEPADNVLDHRGHTWVEVITPRLMPRTKQMGFDTDAMMVYRFRYAARIYVWTLLDTWPEALDARDRLAGAVRSTLLDYPTLTRAGGDSGYLLHSDTITEEFGAPWRHPNTRRVWAPGVLVYEIEEETALPSTRPDPIPYEGVDLRVTLLPYTQPAST